MLIFKTLWLLVLDTYLNVEINIILREIFSKNKTFLNLITQNANINIFNYFLYCKFYTFKN